MGLFQMGRGFIHFCNNDVPAYQVQVSESNSLCCVTATDCQNVAVSAKLHSVQYDSVVNYIVASSDNRRTTRPFVPLEAEGEMVRGGRGRNRRRRLHVYSVHTHEAVGHWHVRVRGGQRMRRLRSRLSVDSDTQKNEHPCAASANARP